MKMYPMWKFYYTRVRRQVGKDTMVRRQAREVSSNNTFVNFLMAAEADFLVDGMINTGGKVMSGCLSATKDKYC